MEQLTQITIAQRPEPQSFSSKQPKVTVTSTLLEWAGRKTVWQPPTDVIDSKEEIILRLEIAGMQDAQFHISIDNQTVAVRGVRGAQPEHGAYQQMEIHTGEFISIVELSSNVIAEQSSVKYDDGFLVLRLPKATT